MTAPRFDFASDNVAGAMPEGVVHSFKAVEIEVDARDGFTVFKIELQRVSKLIHDHAAVGKAGEGIVCCEFFELGGGAAKFSQKQACVAHDDHEV